MSQPIQDLAQLAEALSDQPQLFGGPDVVAIRATREFVHTGNWTIKDGDKVSRIMAAWLDSGSFRRTAVVCGVSRNTVTAVISILEKAGKLEPLKERFARARLEAGAEQLEWLRDVIENRDLEAAAVVLKAGWVGVGIVSDKEAMAPPAAVHFHVHQPAAGPDPVAEYERVLRQARMATVDVESEALATIHTPIGPLAPPATALATPPPAIPPPHASPGSLPATPSGTTGGGGSTSASGGAHTDAST